MIFNYFGSILGLGIVYIFLYTNKGRELIKDIGFKVSWKIIEWTTIVYEFYNKILIPKFHEVTDNNFRKSIKLIRNGEESHSFKNIGEASKVLKNSELDYDFILQTKFHNTDSKKNYTVISEKLNENFENEMEVSDVGFIIFQLGIKDEEGLQKYEINLKEPKNYLVKDNVLKSNFFKYYMKKTYEIDLGDNFNVFYMTNDMSQTNLTNPFFIKFNDVGLTSFPMKKEIIENTEEKEEMKKDYKKKLISNIINQEKLKEHRE